MSSAWTILTGLWEKRTQKIEIISFVGKSPTKHWSLSVQAFAASLGAFLALISISVGLLITSIWLYKDRANLNETIVKNKEQLFNYQVKHKNIYEVAYELPLKQRTYTMGPGRPSMNQAGNNLQLGTSKRKEPWQEVAMETTKTKLENPKLAAAPKPAVKKEKKTTVDPRQEKPSISKRTTRKKSEYSNVKVAESLTKSIADIQNKIISTTTTDLNKVDIKNRDSKNNGPIEKSEQQQAKKPKYIKKSDKS